MNCTPNLTGPCPDSPAGTCCNLFIALVNTLIATNPKISSREYYPDDYAPYLQDQEEFDFIVIGGGSSGSVVSNRLSENPAWKVLVVEAGDYPIPRSEIPLLFYSLWKGEENWNFTTEPTDKACLGIKNKECRLIGGKCLGGSGTTNAMMYLRGNQKDYNTWASQGNPGWDYQSVLEMFHQLEQNFQSLETYNAKQPIESAIEESARILGYPTLTQEANLGYWNTLLTIDQGMRASSAKCFLGKIKTRQNLLVTYNTFVEKILIDEISKKATGVTVLTPNGKKLTLKARKEVILSAGAIKSPQILMLSGVGPKQHLEDLGIRAIEDLKVGENFQDHIMPYCFYVSVSRNAANFSSHIMDDFQQYYMYQDGVFAGIDITNLVGFINTRRNSPYPNIEFSHVIYGRGQNSFILDFLPSVTNIDASAAVEQEVYKYPTLGVLPILTNPKSRGRVLLETTNPQDQPVIYANYLDHPDDLETILEGIRFAEAQLQTPPFQRYEPEILDLGLPSCEGFQFRSDDYWRCYIKSLTSSTYHPAGTCKMGPKVDPESVVDPRLRVHGINNLRVIDTSIMPSIVSVNTYGPSLMIGWKGGQMVLEDWISA